MQRRLLHDWYDVVISLGKVIRDMASVS